MLEAAKKKKEELQAKAVQPICKATRCQKLGHRFQIAVCLIDKVSAMSARSPWSKEEIKEARPRSYPSRHKRRSNLRLISQ